MSANPGSDLVSVVMPAYNAESTIRSSLRSVLNQTFVQLDIIVVDDGSTDSTAAIATAIGAADPRVRLIQQTNAGVAAARNKGVLQARGDLVAFIDADDLWHPAKIEKQVEMLRRLGDRVGVIYTWSWFIDAGDRLEARFFAPDEAGDVYATLVLHNIVGNGSVPLVRKACLVECGGFDTGLRTARAQGCEDLRLWLRIAERYEFAVVPEFLVGYRQDTANMSRNIDEMRRSYSFVIAEARRLHPEVPARVFRWSYGKFLFYLGENCAMSGRRLRAAMLWLQVLARDPPVLLIWRFRRARARLMRALGVRSRVSDGVQFSPQGQKFLPPPRELAMQRPSLSELERRRRAFAANIHIRRR
jgi:glycosyltransferase involved in cell wall biosynthesis